MKLFLQLFCTVLLLSILFFSACIFSIYLIYINLPVIAFFNFVLCTALIIFVGLSNKIDSKDAL